MIRRLKRPKNGLKTDNVKAIYQDSEQTVWIGTYGEGLATLVEGFFTFYNNSDPFASNDITAVFSSKTNIYLGTYNNLIEISLDSIDYWNNIQIFDDEIITSIYQDVDGT